MSNEQDKAPAKSSRAQIDAFLRAAANPAATARGQQLAQQLSLAHDKG